jgi:hypothetical protein
MSWFRFTPPKLGMIRAASKGKLVGYEVRKAAFKKIRKGTKNV